MRVIFAGGGTGGHIYPGIALARYLKKEDPKAEVLFVGTARGLETKIVPMEGFDLKLIRVRAFKRKFSLDTFKTVAEMFVGFAEAGRIIKEFKPDVVVGTGGYVCGPVVMNAVLKGIPAVIHEQNAFPGVTNRILSRFVDSTAISFKESREYFKNARKVVFTGNPVRGEMLNVTREKAREKLGIGRDEALVVVVGGSQGAAAINSCVTEMLKNFYKDGDWSMIFSTGNGQYEVVLEQLKGFSWASVKVVPYIFEAAETYAAADLVVCRGGAITSSELTVLGIPSIMIPLPGAAANHQEHNARALEKAGAAVVITENDLNGKVLYMQIKKLLKDREQLNRMARKAKEAGNPSAAEKIAALIKEAASKKQNA